MMMQNKARDEVRPATRIGSRVVGLLLVALYIASTAGFVTIAGPWYVAAGILGAGIALAFPGLPLTHALIGRLDKILPGGEG